MSQREVVRAVGGNAQRIRDALRILAGDEQSGVEVERGTRNSLLYSLAIDPEQWNPV